MTIQHTQPNKKVSIFRRIFWYLIGYFVVGILIFIWETFFTKSSEGSFTRVYFYAIGPILLLIFTISSLFFLKAKEQTDPVKRYSRLIIGLMIFSLIIFIAAYPLSENIAGLLLRILSFLIVIYVFILSVTNLIKVRFSDDPLSALFLLIGIFYPIFIFLFAIMEFLRLK